MSHFPGFPPGKIRQIRIPDPFFTDILPLVNDLAELKVILYAFWFVEHQDGDARFFTMDDFLLDEIFMQSLGEHSSQALIDALEKATQHGIFLKATLTTNIDTSAVYFINAPRGRAAIQAIQAGQWQPDSSQKISAALKAERPNIFQLYEENIAPLTPLIADILTTASQEYPQDWIEEAFTIAVQKNARNWRFIEAVLKGWKERGKYETHFRDNAENRRRYIEGEYGELIEH